MGKQDSVFGRIVTGPLPGLNSKELSTFVSGYTKIELRKKSGRFLKPNNRERKVLINKSKSHSIEMDRNFRGKSYCFNLAKDVKVGNTAAIKERIGPTSKWRLSRIQNLFWVITVM